VKAQLLLADFAQVADGKLTVVGAGWDKTGPGPSPSGIGLLIGVPWDDTNIRHTVELRLIDSDGQPVADPNGHPIGLQSHFEVGRPPGLLAGADQSVALAMNIGPLPLKPGLRYVWELSIDGESADDWRVAFSMRPAPKK
jgi:hypothetical protein